jgi:thiol-disulfide isomerase/thioredoxin
MKTLENPSSLHDQLAPDQPTAVVFGLSYCPFYRAFRPYFEKFAKAHRDKYCCLLVTLDDYDNPLWEKYLIKVSPTLVIFDGEKIIKRFDGVLNKGLSKKILSEL